MKILFKLFGLGLLVLIGTLVFNTLLFTPPELDAVETQDFQIDEKRAIRLLSEAVQIKTISHQNSADWNATAFENFIAWMRDSYPSLHANTELTRISDYTLLYKWEGTDPSKKPILLTAHYDVVPVIPGTEAQWSYPPYDGTVADGYIWGRGTLDNKSAVTGIADAVETLLGQGFNPSRTVYLSFGHDEELGGNSGAAGVVKHLKDQNVQLEWSLDEGSFLLQGIFPGIDKPVASINVAEKGYMNIDIVGKGDGGHSSMPPRQTAVGVLAQAISKLENNPVPGGLDGISGELFGTLGRYMPFLERMMFANQWLFSGVLESALSASPSSNAMIRTTTAPTMLSGSVKENVLPIEAVNTVNFRLHPRDTPKDVIDHVSRVVQHEHVEVRPHDRQRAASAVSSTTSDGYIAISDTIGKLWGPTVIVPGMTVGGTDSKHYAEVADNAYRFVPMVVGREDLTGFHGTDERLSTDNIIKATKYYALLIMSVTK